MNLEKVTLNLNDKNEYPNMKNSIKIFKIQINKMFLIFNMKTYDKEMNLSISRIKIFDLLSEIKDYREIINSEDKNDIVIKLFNLKLILFNNKSPKYNNIEIDINLNISYLYIFCILN